MDLVLLLLFCVYLVPWFVAEQREHAHRAWILALVLALGWTGVGWIAALAWAFQRPADEEEPTPRLRLIPGGAAAASEPEARPTRRARLRAPERSALEERRP